MSLFSYYYQSPSGLTYPQAVLALSPTAYWRLGDASGSITDSSGNGYDMASNGAPAYGQTGWASDSSTAIYLNGSDYFSLADASWMDLGTDDFSIAFALKFPSWAGAYCNILGHDSLGAAGEIGRAHV